MVDSEKQSQFWSTGSAEDLEVAVDLVKNGKARHGLFFAHLALEQALKAIICRRTGDIAPQIHNLVRLAGLAGVTPDEKQLDLLADMNQFNIEGRYPAYQKAPPNQEEARSYIERVRETISWLTHQ